jgi:hypothetical protein
MWNLSPKAAPVAANSPVSFKGQGPFLEMELGKITGLTALNRRMAAQTPRPPMMNG